ncbi:hypothetical protein [Streptomyces sp. YIM S03343]
MPGLVSQIAGLRRRLTLLPAPARAVGEASNGEPVMVELLVDGVWVDVTGYALVRDDSGSISITKGIRDEGSQTEVGTCSLELNNRDGRFSPRNPSGPYYGLIGRNTPIRVSVPDGLGGKSYRLWGEVSEWAPNWDTSGSDVWTDVSANGILRRLAQGPAPANSVLTTALTTPTPSPSLRAYWPMEDASGATSLASALTSGSTMTWTGTPSLAGYDSFPASDPVPALTSTVLSGGVPKYDDPAATQVRFLCYIPPAGLTNGTVVCAIDQVDYSAGSVQFWELYYGNFGATGRGLTLHALASDGTDLGADLENTYDVRGRLLYVSVEFQESGASITRALRIYDLTSQTSHDVTDTEAASQLTRVTKIQFGPASRSAASPHGSTGLTGCAIGHATVEDTITPVTTLGARLNPIGEAAGRRIQRLCAEQGIAFDAIGDLDDTTALGAQGKSNLLTLLQEACLADGGILYENPAVLGLGYRTRASLYNQATALTLDYTAGSLAQIPVPVEDDRYVQNRVTVTCNGVSGTYEETTGTLSTAYPPAGVGPYGEEVTLSLASTDTATLRDQAAWRVHLGTVDEARFPQISVNLSHPSITADMRRAIIGLRLGDRVQILNPPVWLPPDTIDQLVVGIAETITRFEHKLTFTCQPASPYSHIGVLDAADARIDLDDSVLQADATSGATSIDVTPEWDMSMLWTTDSAEVPWDVRVGGEVMRVTAVSPWASDTFTRVTASGWGTADTGQAWSTSGGSATDYATSGTQGTHSLGSVNVSRYTLVTAPSADVDLRIEVATSALATGGPQYAGMVARYADANNSYTARAAFNTDQTVTLVLQKRVGGTQTDMVSLTVPGTHAAASFFVIRLQAQGAVLRAKCWPLGEVEPGWQVTVADGSHSAPGSVGVRSILSSINTNVLPVTFTYDNFQQVNVQTMTVTRSINGVVKAHSAGEDVRLAYPTTISL